MPRLGANVLSLTAMRVATAGFAFVLVWAIARLAGPGPLGEYAVVVGVLMFTQQLPLLGLHLALVRDIAADLELEEQGRQAQREAGESAQQVMAEPAQQRASAPMQLSELASARQR